MKPELRSYEVQTQSDSILCRNRHHLHPASTGPIVKSEDEPTSVDSGEPQTETLHDVPTVPVSWPWNPQC